MRRLIVTSATMASLAAAFACGPSPGPRAPGSYGREVACEPPPPITLDTCKKIAARRPFYEKCTWRIAPIGFCGGQPPACGAGGSGCVCDGCSSDSQCGEEGKCEEIAAKECGAPRAKVCLSSDHECRKSKGKGCEEGVCIHDGRGNASCGRPDPPAP